MISAALVLAAITVGSNTVSFTATSTGVTTNSPIEFVFTEKGTDRDYEALYLLDDSIADLTAAIEKSGIPRGRPLDPESCRFWPCGPQLKITPSLKDLLDAGSHVLPPFVYAGGTRTKAGGPTAGTSGARAFFACFDLSEAPILFDGSYSQGDVYGWYRPKKEVKKGSRTTFTLSWDGKTACTALDIRFRPNSAAGDFKTIRTASEKSVIDLFCTFDPSLTVDEAQVVAKALNLLDSPRIRINGRRDGELYYRAFLPLEKWRDRRERLTQPFEITLSETNALVVIDEDWSGDQVDPKLTPRSISFADAKLHDKIDTAFVYANKMTKLESVYAMMKQMPQSIRNWYVFRGE